MHRPPFPLSPLSFSWARFLEVAKWVFFYVFGAKIVTFCKIDMVFEKFARTAQESSSKGFSLFLDTIRNPNADATCGAPLKLVSKRS